MALAVLFWNVRKNDGCMASLVRLARSEQVDVLLLAEPLPDLDGLLRGLNQIGQGVYHEASRGLGVKVPLVTRLPAAQVAPLKTNLAGDVTIWRIERTVLPFVLLAAAHLPATVGNVTPAKQHEWAGKLATFLAGVEDGVNSRATMLVGDLNMNPFDEGVVNVTGLHGLMTRELARKQDRVHRGESFRRFYNPMWGHFGDRMAGPAGTYVWDDGQHWHILDQVLVRSPLLDRLLDVRILDHDGVESLLKNGRPNKDELSDHLPLMVRLDV
jgi:hypothetical protein